MSAVLFDYGLVLTGPPDASARATMEHVLGVDEPLLQTAYWKYRDAYDRGKLNGTAYWDSVAHDLCRTLESADIKTLIDADTRLWTVPNQPMINWAGSLQQAGIKTGILSNLGDAMEAGVRSHFPWFSQFFSCTFSHRLGIAKPDEAIYREAALGLAQRPEEILFIDDKLENVLAAEAMGMLGLQYAGLPSFRREMQQRGFDSGLMMAELLSEEHPVPGVLSSKLKLE